MYLVCLILQNYVFGSMGVPFGITAAGTVSLIWLCTFRGSIKSLVWTGTLQTLCLIAALVLILWRLCSLNGFTVGEAIRYVAESPHARWMEWGDWASRQHFAKRFLSGVFIVIVMTGLDQDMMQKNLACKSLRDAQKGMCSYGFSFIPLNLLFLGMGVLLLALASREGIALPAKGDDILPLFCAEGYLVHGVMALLFVGFILCFDAANDSSVIDAIYVVASYTYGPLLGLFAFCMLTRRGLRPVPVPWICVAAPVCCYLLDAWITSACGYRFGYELLMLNGLLTFVGLRAFSKPCSPDMDKR